MEPRIELNAFTSADLKSLVDSLQAGGGSFVPTTDPPGALQEVRVAVYLPRDARVTVPARVVNIVPGSGVYVLFLEGREFTKLQEAVERATAEWKIVDLFGERSVAQQVRGMSLQEKITLARIGGRDAREVLIRDMEKRLHIEVLKNPGIMDEEVAEYSALPGLSPGAIKWLSRQEKHIRRRNVLMNLLMNPGTPVASAIPLLKRLPRPEVERISRMTGRVREAVTRAAERIARPSKRR